MLTAMYLLLSDKNFPSSLPPGPMAIECVFWRKPSKSEGYMLNQQSCALKLSVCVCVCPLIAHKLTGTNLVS